MFFNIEIHCVLRCWGDGGGFLIIGCECDWVNYFSCYSILLVCLSVRVINTKISYTECPIKLNVFCALTILAYSPRLFGNHGEM